MAVSLAIPPFTQQVGAARQVERAVPNGLTSVMISLDSTAFTDPDRTVVLKLFISYDNGGTWNDLAEATYPGGERLGDGGVPETTLGIETTFHRPVGATRRMRATIEAIGGAFVTSGGTLTAT